MLMVQLGLSLIKLVIGLVDANIKHIPTLAIRGSLQLPIPKDVCCLVAVSECVMGWAEASVTADIDAKEGVSFIFSTTVCGTAANKTINRASLNH